MLLAQLRHVARRPGVKFCQLISRRTYSKHMQSRTFEGMCIGLNQFQVGRSSWSNFGYFVHGKDS